MGHIEKELEGVYLRRQLLDGLRSNPIPYGGEDNVKRGFLESALFRDVFGVISDRIGSYSTAQNVLVVGVGMGTGPIELMLRFGDDVNVFSTGLEPELLHTPKTIMTRMMEKRELYEGRVLSDDEAQIVCKRLRQNFRRIALAKLDTFRRQKFDVIIISQGVMGYVHDPIDGINKAKRLLKDDGMGVSELLYVAMEGENSFDADGYPSHQMMKYLNGVGHGFSTFKDMGLSFRRIDDFELPLRKIGEVFTPSYTRTYKI